MATGNTTTDALNDSIPTIIASARLVNEFVGVMPNLVDRQSLDPNTGLTWNEIDLSNLTAQEVTESSELDNPQQLVDTLFQVTPTVTGIQTIITDRVFRRLSSNVVALMGALAQNAIQRKKDQDGLTAIDGATTQLGSAGTVVNSGLVRAAKYRITSNTTEPAPSAPVYTVLHGFVIKGIEEEVLTGVGEAAGQGEIGANNMLNDGLQAQVFRTGYTGMLGGTMLFEDGNITIDGSDDAKGGTFSKMALVLVQGHEPRVEVERRPGTGGGANAVFHYDEFAYGERSSGNWLYEIIADAQNPTS